MKTKAFIFLATTILMGIGSFAQKNKEPFNIEKNINSVGDHIYVVYQDKNATGFKNKPLGEDGNPVDMYGPVMFLKSDKPVNRQFGFNEWKIIQKLNQLALSVLSQQEAAYHSRNTRAICISSSLDGEIVSVSFLVGENNQDLDTKKLERLATLMKENFIIENEPKNKVVQHGYLENSFPVCRFPKKKPVPKEN